MSAKTFWKYVQRGAIDECWPWLGGLTTRGYGQTQLNGRQRGAHQVAFELTNGAIPSGLEVCHTCDNRRCCNPAHLWLGTHLENIRDAHRKMRHMHGARHHNAKITEEQAIEIRNGKWKGRTRKELAERFGISPKQVAKIWSGERWSHLASKHLIAA